MSVPTRKLAALAVIAGLYLLSTLGVLHPPRLFDTATPHFHFALEVTI